MMTFSILCVHSVWCQNTDYYVINHMFKLSHFYLQFSFTIEVRIFWTKHLNTKLYNCSLYSFSVSHTVVWLKGLNDPSRPVKGLSPKTRGLNAHPCLSCRKGVALLSSSDITAVEGAELDIWRGLFRFFTMFLTSSFSGNGHLLYNFLDFFSTGEAHVITM